MHFRPLACYPNMERQDPETPVPPPHDETAIFAMAVRRVMEATDIAPDAVAAAYAKVQGRIVQSLSAPAAARHIPPRSRETISTWRRGGRHWAGWSAAAAVVIAVGLSALGWLRARPGGRAHLPATLTYTTGNAERATVSLPDGNTIMLAVASHVDVPTDYQSGNHTIHLTGAALFVVTHHAEQPLTVVTSAATTRVLGTSFVVRQYPTDPVTTVAVREGKVMVRSLVLTANQQVEIRPGIKGQPHTADPAQFSFASGVLTLHDVSLPVAIQELDRWYDADIRLGDPRLRAQGITGEYTAGSVADLANLLAMTFDVRIVRHGRVLTLYPR